MNDADNKLLARIAKQVHYSYEDNKGVIVSIWERKGEPKEVVVTVSVSKWLWIGLGILHWNIAHQLREIIWGNERIGLPDTYALRVVVR